MNAEEETNQERGLLAMARSDQLRIAIHDWEFDWTPGVGYGMSQQEAGDVLIDAARFALKVWEGDEQILEKVAKAIWRSDTLDVNERRWDGLQEWQRGDYFTQARAAVAAIVEEDEK